MRYSTQSLENNSFIPLHEAFRTLRLLSDQRFINGTDNWRLPTDNDSLASFDKTLASVVQKQPPSKFGRADAPSLWTATHFYLALPTLSYTIRKYGQEDEQTRNIILEKEDLQKYFIAFPYIVKHFREYLQFKQAHGAPSLERWEELLSSATDNGRTGASAASLIELLPFDLRDKALLVLSDQDDSLVGRIVLAYLLGQGTQDADIAFDTRTRQYIAPMHSEAPSMSLFERLIAAQQELGELETFLGQYDEHKHLCLGDFLGLVSWYARPHLVEMMLPGLTGAAEPAIQALIELFDHIITEGGPNYTSPPIDALPSVQKFRDTQSLETIGRLSIVKDILGNDAQAEESEGALLRKLAGHIYPMQERQQDWGNVEYYIPNANRSSGFTVFRQDVANIVFCAAIFAEHNNMAGTVKPDELKVLAKQLGGSQSMQEMRSAVTTHRRALNNLAIDWEIRFAGHERLRLLRFVRQTFGLDTIQPIPVSLGELNKGFAGSYFDGRVYHLKFREAGEKLDMALTLHPNGSHAKSVRYRTMPPSGHTRVSPDGIPYSAWLEVSDSKQGSKPIIIPIPGRGSFDPFGRVGSPHAGEVIGFGCSVHHASLSIILAELASLGASRGDLERVAVSFMHINRNVHERHDLAALQLAQVIAAFTEHRSYTHRDFLRDREDVVIDQSRPHLAAFIRTGDKSMSWAEPQAARLQFGYPALYAFTESPTISPRQSWYDGSVVELPEATVSWQVLNC